MPVLQQNNVNSISAFERIYNATKYETDPSHIMGIINLKFQFFQYLITLMSNTNS